MDDPFCQNFATFENMGISKKKGPVQKSSDSRNLSPALKDLCAITTSNHSEPNTEIRFFRTDHLVGNDMEPSQFLKDICAHATFEEK